MSHAFVKAVLSVGLTKEKYFYVPYVVLPCCAIGKERNQYKQGPCWTVSVRCTKSKQKSVYDVLNILLRFKLKFFDTRFDYCGVMKGNDLFTLRNKCR